ncbi:MAG: NAD(P)/FAD-dependent oxidoreductase [Ignavibacteriae bacterium]|nr:NAD(P)/FAD-dependent oxidoreductase [Ignavibacteriota bacterium]MCB9242709.1 NAD(P)/FAD-dependent oxidoreductase [Ignavibacteriales bacterium]
MKRLLILGAGTSGTMLANKFYNEVDSKEWEITVVDNVKTHYYQPGFLFIPFGIYEEKDVIKPKSELFNEGINVVYKEIDKVEPGKNTVILEDGEELGYDWLIIATGARIAPEEIEGMNGPLWQKDIFDFYTIEGAKALEEKLKDWEGGKMVINIAEMPIKCPVAPLEFAFLADYYFTKKGMRDKVEISFVTPLSGAFTKPKASKLLGNYLEEKNVKTVTDFNIGRVDNDGKKIVSWDEMEEPFDLLVSIPTNKGADYIERSGMGDELNFVPTDKFTLRAKDYENIFVIGDATNLPSSKAGSVAHFQSEVLFENLMHAVKDEPLTAQFDGHANCFIESGFGKAFLIDFNYDTEPLPGSFPLPLVGPFSLLAETKMNHFGKLFFRWTYWNMLLKGHSMPLPSHMSMLGKKVEEEELEIINKEK